MRSSAVVDGALRLALEPCLEAIEAGSRRIVDHLAPLSLSPTTLNRLELIFEEAVANIVRHGFADGGRHAILVIARDHGDAVELVFEDDAPLFDPLSLPPPEPQSDIATARIGGLGVALMRRLAASIEHQPVAGVDRGEPFHQGSSGNRLTVRIAKT